MTTELFPYTHGLERSYVYQTYERREGRSGKREQKWNDVRVEVIIDHSTRLPILQRTELDHYAEPYASFMSESGHSPETKQASAEQCPRS